MRAARSEFIDVRGLRYRITRWGPPSDDPVLLLHGFLDAGATYQFLVDALPAHWSCVAPDWRGFGASQGTGSSYWFPDYLADLDVLLDALVPGRPARVIGHSMGGNVAMLYAGTRPERIRWLASLEGFGLPRMRTEQAPERFAEWLDELRQPPRTSRYPSLDAFAAVLRMRNPRLGAERARFIAEAWTRADGEARELVADPWHRLVNPVLYRRDEAEACWRRITAPVLLLLGELSDYRPRLGADGSDDYFRAMLGSLTLRTLAGVGHMMHHEDPAAVAAAILEFERAVA
jgi:pimeloyl-ACP methyl ester carboxylesterase